MKDGQPILLGEANDRKEPQEPINGPVFEAGPGWGKKTKDWLKKYFFKVVLPVAVAIIIFGVAAGQKDNSGGLSIKNEDLLAGPVFSQLVARGDSKTLLARRALGEYLASNPEVKLVLGQKVFLENHLAALIPKIQLSLNQKIEFKTADIEALIDEAKSLTSSQTEKWAGYGSSAGLK